MDNYSKTPPVLYTNVERDRIYRDAVRLAAEAMQRLGLSFETYFLSDLDETKNSIDRMAFWSRTMAAAMLRGKYPEEEIIQKLVVELAREAIVGH